MNQLIPGNQGNSPFDGIKNVRPDGSEFWSARDLQPLLGYDQWRRFEDSIERAMAACENSGHKASDHFAGAGKMVALGSGSTRKVPDYHLTRYACYLVAMNGDPRKPEIAAAQTYFAVQTYRQETAAAAPSSPDISALVAQNERLVDACLTLAQSNAQLVGMFVTKNGQQRGLSPKRSQPKKPSAFAQPVPPRRPIQADPQREAKLREAEAKDRELSEQLFGKKRQGSGNDQH